MLQEKSISRSQLKSILGGSDDGGATCTCENGTTCPTGTKSCSTRYLNNVQQIGCDGNPYHDC